MSSYYTNIINNVYFDKYGREWYKVGRDMVLIRNQNEVKVSDVPKKVKLK